MSATKDMWIDETERVIDEFAFDRLTRDEALGKLSRLGFPMGEAEILLDGAIS